MIIDRVNNLLFVSDITSIAAWWISSYIDDTTIIHNGPLEVLEWSSCTENKNLDIIYISWSTSTPLSQ